VRCWLLLLCVFIAARVEGGTADHVIIISIDGLRPEFYLPGGLSTNCPTLVQMRDSGSYARQAVSVYPSVTYPAHASIVTGVHPARHGIAANSKCELPDLEGRGYWLASDLQVPAIWDVAHAAGLTVGAVSWPSTAGSRAIDWNLPEFWTTAFGTADQLRAQYATPGLCPMPPKLPADSVAWDARVAECAGEIIRQHQPNLLLVHFVEPDKVQHQGGRRAPDLPAAMRRVDAHVARLLETTRAAGLHSRTTVVVLGDHGFSDVKSSLAVNLLLIQDGLITLRDGKITDWKVIVLNTGGSAAVFLKDPADAKTATRVRALLERHATDTNGKPLYQIIDRPQLTALGGPRDAAFYLEAAPGCMFSGSLKGKNLVRRPPIKGNHGYLPDKPESRTGLVVMGSGIKSGVVVDTARLIDVAPTVAVLLGLKTEGMDGKLIREFLP